MQRIGRKDKAGEDEQQQWRLWENQKTRSFILSGALQLVLGSEDGIFIFENKEGNW